MANTHRGRRLIGLGSALLACGTATWGAPTTGPVVGGGRAASPWLDAAVSDRWPGLTRLSLDGLGGGQLGVDLLVGPAATGPVAGGFDTARPAGEPGAVEYRRAGQLCWTVTVGDRDVRLASRWCDGSPPLTLGFDRARSYPTLLGRIDPRGRVALPAVLHVPSHGTLRLTRAGGTAAVGTLGYRATKGGVWVTFPPAPAADRRVEYRWAVAEVHPPVPAGVPADALRRDWLDVLQLSPSRRVLSNHTASDTCAFCYYEYADVARHTPPLAEGLTALDVMRQTLDAVLAGGTAYGMPGYGKGTYPVASGDTYPSLLIAAADCADGPDGRAWAADRYAGLRGWAEAVLAERADDGTGLVRYAGASGNSGSWADGQPTTRPSNWWDTIGFGHEDAYANALAFRGLRDVAGVAAAAGHAADAARYRAAADHLRSSYFATFHNPATGLIAGWRSADGQLHDYAFPWVSGIAVHYGLVPPDRAGAVMDRLLAKMAEVGFGRFDLGLPGNLVPVPLADYTHRVMKYGGGMRPDNRDGFQVYENGGATACFAYFTVAALYDVGRRADADRMLFPMLRAIGAGDFQGTVDGKSNDWRTWDGRPTGYEGFLVDNYYLLLAALNRDDPTVTAPHD